MGRRERERCPVREGEEGGEVSGYSITDGPDRVSSEGDRKPQINSNGVLKQEDRVNISFTPRYVEGVNTNSP